MENRGFAEGLLHQAMTKLDISARGYNKILKDSRTIADFEGSDNVCMDHISRGCSVQNLDCDLWRKK